LDINQGTGFYTFNGDNNNELFEQQNLIISRHEGQVEDVIPDDEMILETRPFMGTIGHINIYPHSGTHEVNFGSPIKHGHHDDQAQAARDLMDKIFDIELKKEALIKAQR
jgi:hypothetical protein